jgi:HlyD family secretion protein
MAKRALVFGGLGFAIAGFIAWHVTHARNTNREPVGVVRATEIRIAPEVSGRLVLLLVRPGQAVRKGEELARIDNPELAAAVIEARAAAGEARADRDNVYAGLRQEKVSILGREVEKAQSNLTYAEQQLARTSALAANGNASRDALDKATARVSDARSMLSSARSRLAEGQAGPIAEDRAIADATVAAAEAAVAVLERRLAKTVLTAPVDGTVQLIVGEVGEAIVPNRTILTLDARETWFSLTLREDRLAGLAIGAPVQLGSSAGPIAARITEIRGLGAFATWRAARAADDHDLNSFALRLDPVGPPPDLAPGQTVWLASR